MTNEEKIKQLKEKYANLSLDKMLEIHLLEQNKENQRERYEEGRVGEFYPSSIGFCKRRVVYQMMGYPSAINPRSLLIMDNGTYFHERMENYYKEMGILVAPELKLKNEDLLISGRSDAIIYNTFDFDDTIEGEDEEITLHDPTDENKIVYNGPAKDVLIVEFKSSNYKTYDNYIPKTKPQKKHEMQLQLYFHLTGIRRGLVYYENKNTQEHKFFHVSYDKELVEEVLSDIRFVVDHYNKGTLPEKEYEATSFECRYCGFRDICYPTKHIKDLDDII